MSIIDLAKDNSPEYKSVKRQLLSNISTRRQLLRTITHRYNGLDSHEQGTYAPSTNSSLCPMALINLYLYEIVLKECDPYD